MLENYKELLQNESLKEISLTFEYNRDEDIDFVNQLEIEFHKEGWSIEERLSVKDWSNFIVEVTFFRD